MALVELIHQPCEFEQIRHTEERTVVAHDDFRIRSGKVRPLRRNRADCSVIYLQQQALSIKVVALTDADKLLAAKRMKRVRDTYKMRRCDRGTCILE